MKIITPVLLVVMIWNIKPTFAYLMESIPAVINTFHPTNVESEVKEDIEGEVKKTVKVQYNGNTEGYVRVKLIPEYRDADGNLALEEISLSDFSYDTDATNTDWFEKDGYYYYKYVAKPDCADLALPLSNIEAPTSTDGNTAILSVLVQTVDELHVKDAWKVTLDNGVIVG